VTIRSREPGAHPEYPQRPPLLGEARPPTVVVASAGAETVEPRRAMTSARSRVAWAGLGASTALALALNCWQLSLNGLGNTYYSAAVRAMTASWHNFFFAAFDRGGFISVDKPPVMLWITALSARVFGYSTWSLLLPAAIVGAAAVALLWIIVERWFGALAATLAALVLACSPISVAVNRLDLPEPFLLLFLLAAVWALQRSLDDERWLRWTVLAGAFVGLAFNTKMLAAAIPGPALALLVAAGAKEAFTRRALRLAVFALTCLVCSASWLVVVDAIPASSRPYVGGSTDNTVLDLVVGYNGLGRVDGGTQGGAPGGVGRATSAIGGAGGVFGGSPGAGRLLSDALGGQIAWFLPLALGGAAIAAFEHRRHRRRRAAIGLWTGWFTLHAIVFSYAKGTFHAYYTAMLVPSIAALVGIGGASLVRLIRSDARWWAAAGALVAVSATLQLDLIGREPSFYGWTRGLLVIAVSASVIAAAAALSRPARAREVALSIALIGLLATPLGWSISEANNPVLNATLPQAGPRSGVSGATFGSHAYDADPALATFLLARSSRTRWDVVTANAQIASDYIATYGLSVMALGGFMGTDRAATVASFAAHVTAGEVRYVLVDSGISGFGGAGGFNGLGARGGGGFAGGGAIPRTAPNGAAPNAAGPAGRSGVSATSASQILSAVRRTCAAVTNATTDGALASKLNGLLYDCGASGPALAALG
jgi:4-amino-4-deoxy-L-arabinose transferase-like glycosyltransferase